MIWRDAPAPRAVAGTLAEERARLERGIGSARAGVINLMRLLPRLEADLFEPELLMLDELAATFRAGLREGMRAEEVVDGTTAGIDFDLLVDARARILDAIAHDPRSVDEHLVGAEGDVVLVTGDLTPSVVASLPARVVAIVTAASTARGAGPGSASHAAILARGRDIALAVLPEKELSAIAEGDVVIVDTMAPSAVVSVAPSRTEEVAAHAGRHAWLHARAEEEDDVRAPLEHLGIGVHVNVGSLHERVPSAADGIGLVRTELLFSDHRRPPSAAEQLGALCAIAAHAPGKPVTVRLFDVGGDKSVPWLVARSDATAARGIELLLARPDVLDPQLHAIVRAAERADVRVLVPFVKSARQIVDVRARLRGRLPVGALVETPEAVERVEDIASVSDFVAIGTNDLGASIEGAGREQAGLSIEPRLLEAIERVVVVCRARARPVTVCGELAGDAHGARLLVGIGVNGLSVAPSRLGSVKLALRAATLEDCRTIARRALAA